MFKLLIFDLDGTLADTSQDITDALNYALKPFGVREFSVAETKAMVGSGISKLLQSLVPPDAAISDKYVLKSMQAESPADLVIKRFLEHYDNHLINNTVAYASVKDILSKLGDYRKAVLSNKREVYSRRVLEGIGILQYFDVVLGSDSVREKKPSPVPILDLMKMYAVSAEESLIIGDSNFDIEAGKAAGVKVVAVTYGFRSRELLKDADYLIDSFDKLLPIVSGGQR